MFLDLFRSSFVGSFLMAISKNLNLWCCEANVVELDGFVLEKILPKTGLLYPLAEISLMALVVDRV